ncbi:MAG: FKBP-type peptidyl-prolyl cis-trans isomerase [Bacteroidota bacterium]
MFGFKSPFTSDHQKVLLTTFTLAGFVLLLLSCEQQTRQARATDHLKLTDAKVIDYNHQVVRSENIEIEDYIVRHHWKMNQTTTGLRYMIYARGRGQRIVKGNEVRLKYTVSLLDGSQVYSSDALGLKVIYPGESEGETGLQEALLLMSTNDKARLIVPSHLAYGLLGDLKKIPAGAALVYDIEIVVPDKGNR